MTIGDNIRKFRKQKGLTQKELGDLSGINDAQIRRYELGLKNSNPKLETIQKIAKALDVTVQDILTVDVNGTPMLNMMDIEPDDMSNILQNVRDEQKKLAFQKKEAISQSRNPDAIAAHFSGEEFTEEELEEIRQFAEFVKSRRKDKK